MISPDECSLNSAQLRSVGYLSAWWWRRRWHLPLPSATILPFGIFTVSAHRTADMTNDFQQLKQIWTDQKENLECTHSNHATGTSLMGPFRMWILGGTLLGEFLKHGMTFIVVMTSQCGRRRPTRKRTKAENFASGADREAGSNMLIFPPVNMVDKAALYQKSFNLVFPIQIFNTPAYCTRSLVGEVLFLWARKGYQKQSGYHRQKISGDIECSS